MDITYKNIETVNAEMATMDIKGKHYAVVPERVKAFRKLFPLGSITTEIVDMQDGIVTMKCTVTDGERILSTGLAQEKESNSYINKTSYIENCETSAVGRALGMLGLGIGDSIASAEELVNAITNQDKGGKQREATVSVVLRQKIAGREDVLNKVLELCKRDKLADVTDAQAANLLKNWDKVESHES